MKRAIFATVVAKLNRSPNQQPQSPMNEDQTSNAASQASPSADSSSAQAAPAVRRKIIPVPPTARAAKPVRKPKPKKQVETGGQLKELLIKLQQLRQVTRETALAYLTKIDLDLSAVVKRLTDDGKATKRHPLKSGALKQALKLAKKIDLKPAKGRRKDLRKIEKAVDEIKRRIAKK